MKPSAIIHREGEMPFVLSATRKAFQNSDTSLRSDKEPRGGRELVLGDTEREISKKAKALLEAKRDASLSGYLIYSDGSDAAIVWTDFQVIEGALGAFLSLEEISAAGELTSEFFPLLSYLKEREERIKEEKWRALSENIPAEYSEGVVSALRKLYSLSDYNKAAEWFASLYDKKTGGFYISRSAKEQP